METNTAVKNTVTVTVISIFTRVMAALDPARDAAVNAVYDIEVKAGATPDDTLENAFLATSIEERWMEPQVCQTTAGDILVLNGQHYLVTGPGYVPIGRAESERIQAMPAWAWLSGPKIEDAGNEPAHVKQGFELQFDTWTRTTALHVCIVVNRSQIGSPRFGVYVSHGHPGGAFWKNDAPLVTCSSLEEAKEKAAVLYGVAGSDKYAAVIEDHRLQPVNDSVQAAQDLARLVDDYRKAKLLLNNWKWANLPVGACVDVHCKQYVGTGVVEHFSGCPVDQVAVKLPNGNVWWYELAHVQRAL